MSAASQPINTPYEQPSEVRYIDYIRALDLLHAHRVNPAPPFALMIAAAFSLHLAILLGGTLFSTPVESIPVQTLQLRLGGGEGDATGLPALGLPEVAPAAGVQSFKTNVADAAAILEQSLGVSQEEPRSTINRDSSRPVVSASSPQKKSAPAVSASSPSTMPPSTEPRLSVKAPAGMPGGEASGQGSGGKGSPGGSKYGNSSSAHADVIARYEQELSGWLERHKIYPESAALAGLDGRVIVRVQMNRQGKVLGSWIEKSSGHEILDKAVLAQVKRSDPFPAAPANYSGRNLLEFRFPVTLYIR